MRGAENNLSRLDESLITLEGQLQSLKKQARQATGYRNLSDHIRKAEAMLFHVRWIKAIDGLEVDREKLKEAEFREHMEMQMVTLKNWLLWEHWRQVWHMRLIIRWQL